MRKLINQLKKMTVDEVANCLRLLNGRKYLVVDNCAYNYEHVIKNPILKAICFMGEFQPGAWKEQSIPCFTMFLPEESDNAVEAALTRLGKPSFPTWEGSMEDSRTKRIVSENQFQINSVNDVVLGWIPKHLPGGIEAFVVILVNPANVPVHSEYISVGTADQTAVYPREIAKLALKHSATGVIAIHNHPTGFVQPSQADRDITRMIKVALDSLDLRFLDHLIIGIEGKGYYSFRENGLLS